MQLLITCDPRAQVADFMQDSITCDAVVAALAAQLDGACNNRVDPTHGELGLTTKYSRFAVDGSYVPWEASDDEHVLELPQLCTRNGAPPIIQVRFSTV